MNSNIEMNKYIFSHNSFKDGFVFASLTDPKIHDAFVIRNPHVCFSGRYNYSEHSLQEHIDYVKKNKIEKAIILAESIEFITQCSSLKYISIEPVISAPNDFDYSPLYKLEKIKFIRTFTEYGKSFEKSSVIDYSRMRNINLIEEAAITGKGHINYKLMENLEILNLSNDANENLNDFPTHLKKLWIWESKLKSIEGIGKLTSLQDFALAYCNKVEDISELSKINENLRSLWIDHCSKIKDFSCLSQLHNLEVLELEGNNLIPNLNFLSNLKKLKFFKITMNVEDGDLSKCLNVPYVNCKNRKHYNLKNKDLPKNHDGKGFELL